MSLPCKSTRLDSTDGCMEHPTEPGRCFYCDEDYLPGATARERLEAMVRQLSRRPWWRAAA